MLDLCQVNGGGWYIFLGIVIEEFGSCSALFFIDLYASVFCFLFFFVFFFSNYVQETWSCSNSTARDRCGFLLSVNFSIVCLVHHAVACLGLFAQLVSSIRMSCCYCSLWHDYCTSFSYSLYYKVNNNVCAQILETCISL